jgi:hypothetical protein
MQSDQYAPPCYRAPKAAPYGHLIVPESAPEYSLQHVGWKPSYPLEEYFSQNTVNMISREVTALLDNVHPEQKRIVVPDDMIRHVRDRTYDSVRGNARDMVDYVVAVIVNQVRDEMEVSEQNRRLTRWVTRYDENPELGNLRKSDIIYQRRSRDINKGGFVMNY